MAGDYPHALGNIHTIESPYFPNSFYPEADILKAVIYFANCQYDDATTIVAQFKKKYEPIKKELDKRPRRASRARGSERAVLQVPEGRARRQGEPPADASSPSSRTRSPIASCSATSSTSACSTRRTSASRRRPASFRNSPLGDDVQGRAAARARPRRPQRRQARPRALPAQPRRAQRAPPRQREDPHRHHRREAQPARRSDRRRPGHARRSRKRTASSSPTKSTCSGRSTASTGATSSGSTVRSSPRSVGGSDEFV